MVKDPHVILLDEPTSGLDSEMAVSLMDMLVALGINRNVRCAVIETMRSGSKEILRRFNDDSHKANLTFVLPPTASMTAAGYLPHEIYKNA